ncbi:MAG: hypothetical protein IKU39_06450 [Lachnospiraceae bacterium]|nr:hypothetical protein [Lachnospiraceae bacterium]
MKKLLAFVLTMAMTASMLVGCTGTIVVIENLTGNVENVETENVEVAETTEGAVKTGLSVITNLSGEAASAEANGVVTTDISLVAVTVNDNGVIESCAIDAVQGKVAFDSKGQLAAEAGEISSKNELGDNYGMRGFSGIGKEWNEQAAYIADYAEGKTVEELKTNAIDEAGMVKDADLASGATIYMGSFIWAIEDAVNNAKHCGAQSGDQLVLTSISSSNGSAAATAEAEGSASVTSNIIAMTTNGDVIISCIIDAVQSKAGFAADGTLVGEVAGSVLSKAQLGEDYGLKAYSGVGKEWDEQTLAFCEYVTGKTVEEATSIALTETTAPADADLAASVSIAVGDFVNLVKKAGEGVASETTTVKTGFAVSATIGAESAGEKDGTTTTDISVVAVTVTEDGVIESCKIDAVQGKVSFTAEGKISSEAGAVLSKKELGDDYGMRVASGIGKEWDEQIAAIEAYAVGKTVEELKTKAIDENGVVADADLASGATLYMGSFIWAIEAAVNNAQDLGANSGDELILVTNSKASGTDASAETDGTTQVDSNVAVFTMKDGVITSCIIDAVQAKASFDTKGVAAEIADANVLSKAQLGEGYGLKAFSAIGKEWNEQTDAFCAYITGKTVEEVKGIALTETTAPADADLAASVSIAVGDFMGLVEKAAK